MTNLLLVMSDQHAQRIAGCYGDASGVTPNLDRLAAEGVTFDNAYCNAPICLPARMSALTGRHPFRQTCWTNTDYLASDIPTMAHALGAAGYAPVLVGRMHALGPDQLHGYVRREIGDHSSNWIGIPRNDMGSLHLANDPFRRSIEASGIGRSAYEVKDEDVTAAAVAQLDTYGAARRAGDARPFALTVGYMLPHPPYVCRADDYRRFEGRTPPPSIPRPAPEKEHPWHAWWRENRGIADVAAEAATRARTAYYGLTWRMDAMLGEILAALDRNGLSDDTLVVYTSDHGDHVGDRGLWWKHTFFDESLKVPLVMRWPGRLPAGERRAHAVSLIDLGPTMLEALEAPALPNADGRSFLAAVRDASAPWRDEVFAEYCTDPTPAWTGGMAVRQRMIRTARWKLCWYGGYRPQLFDLDADPMEQDDLGESPAHAAVRDGLMARLLAEWDPDEIDRIMRAREADKALIGAWGRATSPPETLRWEIRPVHNYLGLPGDAEGRA
jgi:choline-sulfatase